ncbi:MAG: hypothetical protein K1X81_06230 [Bacteroidia bacterium]|nr:hypothetical protein [Bacteroidia bacterium]
MAEINNLDQFCGPNPQLPEDKNDLIKNLIMRNIGGKKNLPTCDGRVGCIGLPCCGANCSLGPCSDNLCTTGGGDCCMAVCYADCAKCKIWV